MAYQELIMKKQKIWTNELRDWIKQSKTLPTQKTSELDANTGKFYQTFEELTPILFKLFQ